jgi:hypothetical protein
VAASTCVVDYLAFATTGSSQQDPAATSRELDLAISVLDMTDDDSELLTSSRVSPTKTLSRGYLLLGGQCEVFLGK